MYLIICYQGKDIAKVWQKNREIKFEVFNPEFQKDIGSAIKSGLELILTWDKEAGEERIKKSDPLISRLGHAFSWHIVKIRNQPIDVDMVDEKTGKRWSTKLHIIKDQKSTGK